MAVVVPIISTFDAKGITKAIRDFKSLDSAGKRSTMVLLSMDKAAKRVASGLTKVGMGAAAFGAFAVKSFADFDAALNKSLSIMGDVSESMSAEMATAARQMAKQTTFSAVEAADSYFYLASAGLNAEQSIKALPIVAKFAQAGMFDMALATDLLTDAQSALGLTMRNDVVANMQNMTRVSDVLVKANTIANATVEQFSKSLTNKAGAALRATNKDIEEGVAVLAAFADQGIKGEEAGTQFAIVMRDLQTRALTNASAFRQANVEVFDQNGAMNNLGIIVQQLENRLGSMSVAQKRAELATLGFTDKSVASITALLGTSDAIINYEKQLRSAAGTTDEVSAKQLQTLNAQIKLLKDNFIDIVITIGESLEPKIAGLVTVLQETSTLIGEQGVGAGLKYLGGQFLDMTGNMGKFGNILLGLVATFTALRLITIAATISQVLFNVALFSNPIGIVVAAVIAFGVALVALAVKFKVVRDVFKAVWNTIVDFFQFQINIALGVYEFFINKIIDGVNLIIKAWNKIPFHKDVEEIKHLNLQLDITALKVGKVGKAAQTSAADFRKFESGTKQVAKSLSGSATGVGDTGGVAGATKTVADKFKTFSDAAKAVVSDQKNLRDALKNTSDAQKALQTATDNVASAQAKLNQIAKGYGAGSDEANTAQEELNKANRDAIKAGYDLTKANYAVSDAQEELRRARLRGNPREIVEAEIALGEAVIAQTEAQNAVKDATDAVNQAQTNLNETINGASTSSDTYKTALEELNDAQTAQLDAIEKVRSAKEREIEVTRNLAKAEILLRKAKGGLTKKQLAAANKLLAELNAPVTVTVPTPTSVSSVSSSNTFGGLDFSGINVGGLATLAEGGIAMKPTVALIAEGGEPEAVIPLSKMGNMGGDTIINVTVTSADPNAVVDALRRYQRQNGALPLRVQG